MHYCGDWSRAGDRCEYCQAPARLCFQPHQVDHIVAIKHGGQSIEANLALSCIICNQHKGSDFASIDWQTDQVSMLFHPRRDRWSDHFQLRNAIIVPLTATGRVTVRLLKFNTPERVVERTWFIHAGAFPPP
ncbi:MAG: HNH endonuclease [Verrucomicrobiales bacterium]|nr:HNH endonuclease [Verrucomicrobiales bacterium]